MACTWNISSVGKDQFNSWKFYVLKIRPIVCLCNNSTQFSFWVRQHTLRFLFGDSRSFYCHLLMKSTFLVSEGLLCLYVKQNNTWLLVDMKFFFSFLNRHLIRSLRLLVSYRVKYSKRNSISSAPRYYFTIYCAAGVFLGSNVNMNFLTTRIPFFWYD